jgi:general secretion pathway protein D
MKTAHSAHPVRPGFRRPGASASTLVAGFLAAQLFSAPLHAQTPLAAVVVGADGKTIKVDQDQPPQATPPPGTPPPPATAPAALERRRNRRAPPTGAAGAAGTTAPSPVPSIANTPPPSGTGPVTGSIATGGADMPGEREFNSCRKFPANKRIVKLNMKPETELGDLISWISSITCRQFLLPGTIPANSKKVTIIAPQLITPEEAYRLFLAALDSVGLTVEPSGKFLRIIETLKAKSSSIPIYGAGADVPASEAYVTRLIRVDNGDVNELSQVLGRLKGEQGDVIVYPPQGALIITDQASNIARMVRILKELDQPGTAEKVWIVRMKNTAASEMAQKLAEIFQVSHLGGRKGGGAPAGAAPAGAAAAGRRVADLATEMSISKIIPDERSNQLIIIANEKTYARVLTMVRKLDVPIEGGDGRIHVYYCENANCDELAATLGAVTGVAVAGGGGGRATRAGRGAAGQGAPTPAPAPGGAGGQGQGSNLLFEGEVRINFDRPTNSLIVLSSLKDYQSLRRVIERLDSPRKQVFIEALILEVTIDKTRELGASFHGAKPQNLFGMNDPGLILGGLNPGKTLSPAGLIAETMLAGVLGPVLSQTEARSFGASATATVDIPSFGVLIKALQTNSDVDVLSNPHLLIMNNEEGEISVGSRIPFPVSTLGLGGGGGLPGGAAGAAGLAGLGLGGLFPQVQREKVALEMKLIPHINEHDMIRLEVEEKISEVAPGDSRLGPSTSERSAKTMVVAKDQQTILIGGLMSDKVVNSITKIPLLGDIPILGFFFRNSTRKVVKTNLIIALTPYIISDQSDLRRVLEKKMKERREFVERFGGARPNPEADIDYRRKRGMLEEINRAAREAEEEEGEIQRIRERDALDESGPVDLPPGYKAPGTVGVTPVSQPVPGGAPPPPPPPAAPPGTPVPQ